MGNSFYVQISPYLLAEYTYGGPDSTYVANPSVSGVQFGKITNQYYNGQLQMVNTSAAVDTTQNVLNYSAARLSGNRWAFLTTELPTPYINTDTRLQYTDLSSTIVETVLYDSVKIHIVSGYRLTGLDGLIIQVYANESQTGLTSILANNVFLNSDSRDILNPQPIIMGDRTYDRYVELLIPSVKGINTDFYSNPTNPALLGYQFSSDHRGLLRNSNIYLQVFEIASTDNVNGLIFFNSGNAYQVSVNQEDTYSALAANIQEATDGDYFIYYPSYAGDFISNFIDDLNAGGGDYVVINDITVYEQVGTNQVQTFSFSQMQLTGFDQSISWRPIIQYADVAVSFSVDYMVRIFNRQNGFQMIRNASVTSFYPKKYGKHLNQIALAQQTYPVKVYNKVVSGPTVNFPQLPSNTTFNTVYVPVFYQSEQLVLQIGSITTPTGTTDATQGVYFGQGDAMIYISDHDTKINFIIHRVDPKSGALTFVDLTVGEIFLVFYDSGGNPITVGADASIQQNSKSMGEIIFSVPGNLRKKILYDSNTKPFNITVGSTASAPTIMYSGSVDNVSNIGNESARVKAIVSTASSLTSVLASKGSTSSGSSSSTSNSSSVSYNPPSSGSLLQQLITSNSQALSSQDKQTVSQPHIPGYSNDTNAVSLKSGLKPQVYSPNVALQSKLAGAQGIITSTSTYNKNSNSSNT